MSNMSSVIDGLGTIALFDKIFGGSKDDARITALEARVDNLEKGIENINTKVDSLGSTQEQILNEIRAMRKEGK